jgi:hypothetical protein
MSVGERVVALAAVLTAGGALVSGCSPSATTSSSPSTRVSTAPTAPCNTFTAETTRLVVAAFLDAYNAGTPDVTDRFIAPVDQFQWYGAPGRQFPVDPASTDRGTLPAYFAAQHAKGDRLDLKDFSYSGITNGETTGYANFGYTLVHSVGGGARRDAPGKGAIACRTGKIAVWRISSW